MRLFFNSFSTIREPSTSFDANFVSDYGAEAYMERFWGGVGIQNGNEIVRLSGGFDSSYIGKTVAFKQTSKDVIGLTTNTYAVITEVLSVNVIRVDKTFDVEVTDGDGYFFFDNSNAYAAAIADADNSGKDWKVYVPASVDPYVIPALTQVSGGGGIIFSSDTTGDEKRGSATFKIFKEDEVGSHFMFGTLDVGEMSSYTQGVEYINICTRDNYSFILEDEDVLFRYPTSGDVNISPTAYVKGCDMSHDYNSYIDDARAYLLTKYTVSETEDLLDRNYNSSTPTIVKSSSGGYGTSLNPSVFHFENCELFYGRYFTVRFSLRNGNADFASSLLIHKNVSFGGTKPSFRGGMFSTDNIKVSADVINDIDGDPTIIVNRSDSPREFDYYSLFSSNYDAFGYRLYNASRYYWELSNGIDTKSAQNYEGACKRTSGKPVKVGNVIKSYDRGNGVYDVLINRDVDCDQQDLGLSTNERPSGVVFSDYIGGDNNGTLQYVDANSANSIVSEDRGELRDYKGWVRYVSSDTNENPAYLEDWGSVERPSINAPKPHFCLSNDTLDQSLNQGDILAVESAFSQSPMMTVSNLGSGNFGFTFDSLIRRDDARGYNMRWIQDLDNNEVVELSDGDTYNANVQYINVFPSWTHGDGLFQCKTWSRYDVDTVDSYAGEYSQITSSTNASLYYQHRALPEAEIRVGSPVGTSLGASIFMLNIQTSPNKDYGIAPFEDGETLYSWFSGSGNQNWTREGYNKHRGTEFSINKWDIGTFSNGDTVNVNYFNKSTTGAAPETYTHYFYGSDAGGTNGSTLWEWEYSEWNNLGGINQFQRRGGYAGDGNRHIFKNCLLPHDINSSQTGLPIEIDGGESMWIGTLSPSDVFVKNKPKLFGDTDNGVTDETGGGYCFNGIPQGGATDCN